jgi:hypothetical protein
MVEAGQEDGGRPVGCRQAGSIEASRENGGS